MNDNRQSDLRSYYQRELTYLRRMGVEFARQYPKIASRLELGADQSADPHVERLIQAFAFLTARIQRQIESEFPEITTSLLNILYPHYLNPVPSMAIARFEVDPEQGQLTSGYRIEKHTPLFAQSREGLTCRFHTCYPVTLWPLEVIYAGFESTDEFDFLDNVPGVATVLRLKLMPQGVPLQELELRDLRFYLNGEWRMVNALYELLFCHLKDVALWDERNKKHIPLPEGCVRPVGYGLEEEVLPYPDYAHPGYRLLQEYFAFPQKFMFFEIHGLGRTAELEIGNSEEGVLDVLIMLDETPGDRIILDTDTFCPGCAPIINLFRKTAEPIRLDQTQSEYRLVPDMRQERTTEIHSILSVSAFPDPADATQSFEPFYSFNHQMAGSDHKAFWHARRQPMERADVTGSEMFISFLDLDFNPGVPPAQTIYAHTLCTNRDLAVQLPAGARLQIEEAAPLSRISCLTRPTPQLEPPLGGATAWRLISHLSLNYLSLSDRLLFDMGHRYRIYLENKNLSELERVFEENGISLSQDLDIWEKEGEWRIHDKGERQQYVVRGEDDHLKVYRYGKSLEALREILGLYDFIDSPTTRKQIQGIVEMSTRRVVRRIGQEPWRGFCRGMEVALVFDEDLYAGGSAFLLASVLNHFFALYASVNSFTQVVVRSEAREGEWKRWPPMVGEQIVL
jgi:type VI secretion system protein ImpG